MGDVFFSQFDSVFFCFGGRVGGWMAGGQVGRRAYRSRFLRRAFSRRKRQLGSSPAPSNPGLSMSSLCED